MDFITYADYMAMYGKGTETDFNRLSFKAYCLLSAMTSGVDGYEKLEQSPPADKKTLDAIKYCLGEIIHAMAEIESAEKNSGLIKREDGSAVPVVVSSVSSGSETITYSTNGASTTLSAAVSDFKARTALFSGIVRNYLSGMKDANGVNLLYMGVYPHV